MAKTRPKKYLFINNQTYKVKRVFTRSKKRAIELNKDPSFEYITQKEYEYFKSLQ